MSPSYVKKQVGGLDLLMVPGDPEGGCILLFHGYGSNAFDVYPLSQIYKGSPRPTWIFPNGPIDVPIQPGYVGKAWFPIDLESLQRALWEKNVDAVGKTFPTDLSLIREHIETMISELGILREKLILGGFSQGAVIATDLVLNAKEKSGGLLVFSGALINEKTWKTSKDSHAGIPFFQSHGKNDTLLPLNGAKELEHLLKERGLQGELHIFSGGHEIPQETLIRTQQFLHKILHQD